MASDTPMREPVQPNAFLSTAPAMDALTRLGQGLGARKPLLVLTGEAGLGKSVLAREATRRWSDRATVAWMSEPHIVPKDIAGTLVALFGGAQKSGSSPLTLSERLLETLANATSGGRVAVLVVDDAHALADDVLVELQRVADKAEQRQCPLEVLLLGQPALAARLAEPGLAAVAERIALQVLLAPLSSHETRRYILQLPPASGAGKAPQFSRKACRDIHSASHGVPGEIEAIASEAARRAVRANATTVSPEHVRSAVQSLSARKESPAPAAKAASPRQAAKAEASAAKSEPAVAKSEPAVAKSQATTAKPAPAKRAPEAAAPRQAAASPAPAPLPAPVPAQAANDSAASEPPAEEFTPSDDPRVKDWIARFGGAGVRIGGIYMGPEAEEEAQPEEVPAAAATSVVGPAPPSDGPQGARPGVRLIVDSSVTEGIGPVAWPPARGSSRKGPVLGKRRDSGLLWPAVALLLAIALGAVVLAQRRALDRSETGMSMAEMRAADSLETLESSKLSKSRRSSRGSTASRAQRVERSQGAEPAPEPGAKGVHYTIITGAFLERDMAWAEREHLARLTTYPVWVSRRSVDGVRTYRVILGAFSSRTLAESTAQSLLQQGLLRDANVVSLPLAQ